MQTTINKLQSIANDPKCSIYIKDYIYRIITELEHYQSIIFEEDIAKINNLIELLHTCKNEENCRQILAKITFIIHAAKNNHKSSNISQQSPRYARVKNIINNLKHCVINYEDPDMRMLARSSLSEFQKNVTKLTDSEIERIYDLTRNSFIPRHSLVIILTICKRSNSRQ